MKILFITNNLPPIVDGVGDYTYNIARQFAEHDHEVYIVCKMNPKINTDVKGITILDIVEKWNFNCHKPIVKLIKEKGIDIVSLQYVPHGFHPKGMPLGLIRLMIKVKKTGVKTMIFFHEIYLNYLGFKIHRTLCSFVTKYIAKRLINESDYHATSIEHYRNLITKYKNRANVSVIRIASNIPMHTYENDYLEHLKMKIAPKGEFIILFFGKRNIETHIEAIKELINEGYKIIALSLGSTYFLKYDYNIPTYKTGLLDINELSQYFQIADCLCLPENEKSGATFKSGSLAAGLQYGLPIITNKGFMTESILIDDVNILFVNNKNEIKTSIKRIINNKDHRMYIGKNALSIGKSLTWENTYNEYMNLIK